MVTLAFEDEIVSATKFRGEQSHWLELARKRPITITNGDNKVTIINRNDIRNLVISRNYLELAVRLCDELEKNQKSSTLYWLEYLDNKDRKLFIKELVSNIMISVTTGNWDNLGELLEDWKATAETVNNAEVVKALDGDISPKDYVTIK
jgi:hypothetical protein